MADYYSILKKTIASLPENNGAARRGVYSRARNAIVNQLKAYEPPLSPSEITAEQLRLEEAIRKVEAEAARETLGLGALTPAAEEPPAPADSAPAVAPPTAAQPSEPAPEPAPTANVQPAAPAEKPEPRVEPEPVASLEPRIEPKPAVKEPAVVEPTPSAEEKTATAAPEVSISGTGSTDGDKPRQRASDVFKRGGGESRRMMPLLMTGLLVLIAVVIAAIVYSQKDMISEMIAGTETAPTGTEPADTAPATSVSTDSEPAQTADSDEEGVKKNADRLLDDSGKPAAAPDARTVTTTLITPGQNQGETVIAPSGDIETSTPPGADNSADQQPVPVRPADPQAQAGGETPATTVPQAADVAATQAPVPVDASGQRSILYEEGDGSNGAGTASQGEVSWSIGEEENAKGVRQAVLTASAKIPDRDVEITVRIKPNDDESLPASHLVEIQYKLPEGFSAGDVANVPGLVMKPTEEARGDALLGASVKVSPGYFWIALSNIDSERQRNMDLLRDRDWIDIPMLYDNGKRGILTLEKGDPGKDAVNQAVVAWQAG